MISTCVQCKKSHNTGSPWCGPCDKELNEWAGPQNQSSDEKLTTAKRKSDSGGMTPSGELKSLNAGELITKPTPKNIENKIVKNITLTKKNEINSEPNGAAEIGSDSLNTNEPITERMPTVSESSSMTPAIVETQAGVYTESFSDLKKEISLSINLLNQSEQELFDSMKGLRASQPETTIRLYDPERVQTAVLCGRQIVESMKTKLELLKFSKKLGRSNESNRS